jgi:hypothetical protein
VDLTTERAVVSFVVPGSCVASVRHGGGLADDVASRSRLGWRLARDAGVRFGRRRACGADAGNAPAVRRAREAVDNRGFTFF